MLPKPSQLNKNKSYQEQINEINNYLTRLVNELEPLSKNVNGLEEKIKSQMPQVKDGKNGQDGKDGKDGVQINDSTIAATTTWSSEKINSMLKPKGVSENDSI